MTVWHYLFMGVTYSAILACLYAAYKTSVVNPAEGARQLVTIGAFVVLYWLLESWGYYRAPYYFYPTVFPDMTDHFKWTQFAWFNHYFGEASNLCPIGVTDHPCADNLTRGDVVGAVAKPDSKISLSVLFLEASLTFSVMTTARLFNQAPKGRYLMPFLAAVVLVAVDALLDPVFSQSYDIALDVAVGDGVQFWQWCVCEDLGLDWLGIPLFHYGVPVFNNAVWFAGPIILVSLALIFEWLEWVLGMAVGTGGGGGPPPLTLSQVVYLLIILFGAFLIFAYSPSLDDLFGFKVPIWLQNLMLVLLIVGIAVATVALSGTFTGGRPFRYELAYPAVATLVLAVLAYLFAEAGALLTTLEWLWIIAVAVLLSVVAFLLRPYV